jgi:hypothetical protein
VSDQVDQVLPVPKLADAARVREEVPGGDGDLGGGRAGGSLLHVGCVGGGGGFTWMIDRLVDPAIDQSINQPLNRWIGRSVGWSIIRVGS